MINEQSAPVAITSDGSRIRSWQRLAIACAVLTILPEFWYVFLYPQGAVVKVALFVAGIGWLWRRGGRAPAIFLGVLFAVELIFEFTIFGAIAELRHERSWTEFSLALVTTLADLAGLIACLVLAAGHGPRHVVHNRFT